jgi:hypothetical protein
MAGACTSRRDRKYSQCTSVPFKNEPKTFVKTTGAPGTCQYLIIAIVSAHFHQGAFDMVTIMGAEARHLAKSIAAISNAVCAVRTPKIGNILHEPTSLSSLWRCNFDLPLANMTIRR